MKLLGGLKNFISKADLLSSKTLLRVKGQPQFQTMLGGFISISLMIMLAAAFYNKIIDTFNRVLITASATATNAEDPTSFSINTIGGGGGDFMFGVQVWHHDLNTGKRYFDIVLTGTIYDYGEPSNRSAQYPLQPCRKDHWDGYPHIQENFQMLQMNYWMCLPKSTSYQIKGKYSSVQSKTLDVAVKKCTNQSSDPRPCATQEQISQLFIDNDGPMFFTIYFINPLINPQSQEYLTYYLEDSNYIAFSAVGGEESRLFVEDYEIQTDQSILPLTDSFLETGGIISSSPLKSTYTQVTDTYAVFFFYKSPISRKYNRSFQKLDDVFSYVGGLFGTILIIFFLVSSYNTHKFQINISGYLYSTDQKEQKLQKKYNFVYFLGQMLYSILKTLKINPDWKTLKYYHQTREEALKQLDILFLFKRVNFLEKSLSLLFSESQLKGLHLSSHTTKDQAIRMRRNYKLKPKLKYKIEEVLKQKDEKSYFGQQQQFDKFGNNISCEVFKDQKQLKSQKQKGQATKASLINNDNFLSDHYSSQSSSSDEQCSNLIAPVLELKKESQRNPISKKIWKNVDSRLKNLLTPIQRNYQDEQKQTAKEEIQEHKIANQEEQNPNLFLFQDNNIYEINEESQNQSNYIFAKQNFAKLKPINKSSLEIYEKQK